MHASYHRGQSSFTAQRQNRNITNNQFYSLRKINFIIQKLQHKFMSPIPSLDDIKEVHERIKPFIHQTPVLSSTRYQRTGWLRDFF